MKKYTVKAGDSLSSIAMKTLGSFAAWREIAELNDIPDPSKIEVGQVLTLPGEEVPENSTQESDVIITEEGDRVYYRYQDDPTKRYLGKKFRKGLFRQGQQKTEDFIANNSKLLTKLNLSKSEVNALLATSENEGNMDAVNTWDNSFMSFGMFQWTLGATDAKGELPALMKLVQQHYPDAFEQYCGQFGVKVAASTNDQYGYLIYKGKTINSTELKTAFRSNTSAYRFAIAGTDARVNSVQVLHAINRFNWFYFNKSSKLGGYSINDLLSSEYAAALLLDNHVNRPGYVLSCVAKGVANTGLTFDQLAKGSDQDEMKAIQQYLVVRATYGSSPMTNAEHRAVVTKKYLNAGKISAKRKSFKSNRDKRG